MSSILQTFAFLMLVIVITLAYKYELQFLDEELFLKCPEYPNNSLHSFVTMPENITILEDVATYIAGDIKIIHDFKPTDYPTHIEFYKRKRGNWQKTIYTIQRKDFCTSFFNPIEIWTSFIKNIPEEQRKCPLVKAQIFSLNLTVDQSIEMPSRGLEGEYWGRLELGDKANLKEFCCLDSYFILYRS